MIGFFFYTDPGSGMMLLQVLLAFFASVLFYFRKFFYKLFGKNKAAETQADDKEQVSESSQDKADEV